MRNKEEKPKKSKKISFGIKGLFLCYLIVVIIVTLFGRSAVWQNQKIMPLFYSYRDAWVNFSIKAWSMIILNVCMFVPFGIFLPVCVKKCRGWWPVAISGFLFTFLIESVQLFSKRGIFELDDLLGNTMGTLIGYGLFAIWWKIFKNRKQQWKLSWKQVLLYQLPLLLMLTLFGTILGIYHHKEFGNVPGQCIMPYPKGKLEVAAEKKFSKKRTESAVYQCQIFTREELTERARQIFEHLGTNLDESRNDFYEDVAVFYADNRYSLWMQFHGGSYRLVDHDAIGAEKKHVKRDATEHEMRVVFENYIGKLPEQATFSWRESDETYCFSVLEHGEHQQMKKGEIQGKYYGNGIVQELRNGVVDYTFCKKVKIQSEREAYARLKKGEFSYYGNEKLKINVLDCSLDYRLDSKGFYQPVYVFDVMINGRKEQIELTAVL